MSELTVKINVDIDDAIEKITKVKRALHELNETTIKVGVGATGSASLASKSIEQFQRDSYLHDTSTCDLVNELVRRTGVHEYNVAPDELYRLRIETGWTGNGRVFTDNGPARILVVTD